MDDKARAAAELEAASRALEAALKRHRKAKRRLAELEPQHAGVGRDALEPPGGKRVDVKKLSQSD